ncbi:hypothetical protein FACS1894203_4160 [Bacteroidia bacterium]|nr:hypothetical protein FACS1894203_4160 [Bacteroidia bacterium]
MKYDVFANRHVGISETDMKEMLNKIKVTGLEQLINETIPENIRLKNELNLPLAMNERE